MSDTTSSPYLNGAPVNEWRASIHATGEMADRIRAFPWHETSIGPISGWPDTLTQSIGLMLESGFPTSVLWGAEMLQFYNDAYLPLTAEKHPSLLGRSCPEQWPEAWHIIGPQFAAVYERGETVYRENVLVPVRRKGTLKDVYWTYSYSPIRDSDGSIQGVLIVCHDTTGEVLATRERDEIAGDLRTVLDSITDGLLVLDKDWRYTYFNEQGARMIGMPTEALIGSCVWEIFPHARGTVFYEGYHRAVETGQPVQFEEFYPEPLNKWLECRCFPSASGLSVYFRDISERKRSDRELAESEARLRTLVDSIPTLAWMADKDGWIFWYNRRWYKYTGTRAEEMEGWGWQSVHHPSALPNVLSRYKASIGTGEPFQMVFPLRGADGVFRSFMTRMTPAKDAAGDVTRWFGTNTEIDELQRVREALEASEERIRIALKNVPLVLYTADRENRYTWLHRAHPRFNIEEIVGRTDDELDPDGAYSEVRDFKKSVMERDAADRREMRVSIRGSSEIYDMTAEPIHDEMGGVVGVTVAAHDITRLKLAEEALRRNEKLAIAGRLAATIAHEINNPLEAVTNLLYLLRTGCTDEQSLVLIESAEEELGRVSLIVAQSLRFHRQSTLATEERLSALLEGAVAIYKGRIASERINLMRDYRDRRTVHCYASELRQVFGNFIGNAFDAVRQGGTILLRTRESRDVTTGEPGVRVTVADSGYGMDGPTLSRIAEPFFTTKGVNGTGLGLWISREILQKHRSKLSVRSSRREGRGGTTFSVFIPSKAIVDPNTTSGQAAAAFDRESR